MQNNIVLGSDTNLHVQFILACFDTQIFKMLYFCWDTKKVVHRELSVRSIQFSFSVRRWNS